MVALAGGVTQSALTQDALRRARREVAAACAGLKKQIRASAAGGSDDTGWKIGGVRGFLMAFVAALAALFQIRDRCPDRASGENALLPPVAAAGYNADDGKTAKRAAVSGCRGVGLPRCRAALILMQLPRP